MPLTLQGDTLRTDGLITANQVDGHRVAGVRRRRSGNGQRIDVRRHDHASRLRQAADHARLVDRVRLLSRQRHGNHSIASLPAARCRTLAEIAASTPEHAKLDRRGTGLPRGFSRVAKSALEATRRCACEYQTALPGSQARFSASIHFVKPGQRSTALRSRLSAPGASPLSFVSRWLPRGVQARHRADQRIDALIVDRHWLAPRLVTVTGDRADLERRARIRLPHRRTDATSCETPTISTSTTSIIRESPRVA